MLLHRLLVGVPCPALGLQVLRDGVVVLRPQLAFPLDVFPGVVQLVFQLLLQDVQAVLDATASVLQVPRVPVHRLTQETLHASQPLLEGGVMPLPDLPLLPQVLGDCLLVQLPQRAILRGLGVQLVDLAVCGLDLLRVPADRVPQLALQVVDLLRRRRVVGVLRGLLTDRGGARLLQVLDHAAVRLAGDDARVEAVDLGMCLGDLLVVPLCLLVQQLLDVGQALRDGGVVRATSSSLRGQLGVVRTKGFERLAVHMGGVAEDVLDVLEPLPQGGVAEVQLRLVARQAPVRLLQLSHRRPHPLARIQPTDHLLQLALCKLSLLLLLQGGCVQGLLQPLQAIRHRGVVHLPPSQLAAEPRVLGLVRVQLSLLLVGVLSDQGLQMVDARLEGGAVAVAGLAIPLELLPHRAKVRVSGGPLLAQASLELVYLGRRGGELLRVLVRRLMQQAFQVAEPLRQRRVVSVAGLHLIGQLGMRELVNLQLLRVLVRAVPDQAFQVQQPLFHRSVVFLSLAQFLLEILTHHRVVLLTVSPLLRELRLQLICLCVRGR
mmetsp:Transcript_32533/g.82228  ORF Transcript_32533/g.82228 Transcript_32533/m.82228 type:complete len:547 (-) Transcript_32533:2660-4300(-)